MASQTPLVPMGDPTLEHDADAQGGAAEPSMPDALDDSSPYSLVRMVSPALRQAMLELPEDLDDLGEGELRQLVQPTTTDYSLRASFWREYEKQVRLGRERIQNVDVFGGICSAAYFTRLIGTPNKVAWLIRPMQTYKREMEAILTRGNQRLWELINMDLCDPDGRINVRRGELFLKAYQEVGNRVKGMAVQRVKEDRRSLSAHVRVTRSEDSPRQVPRQSLGELRSRLKELEVSRVKPTKAKLPDSLGGDVGEVRAQSLPSGEGERSVITVGVVSSEDSGPGEG